MSRRQFLAAAGAGAAILVVPGLVRPSRVVASTGATEDNVVLKWNKAALQGVRDSKLGPPMVARALAIIHTCAYDAWAAYDSVAVGTRVGGALRRPANEQTLASKNQAISFACYRAAVDLFPGDRATVFDPLMASLGYHPSDLSTDTTTPSGIGNVAAQSVLDFRHRDGANQLGDEPGGTPATSYSDYTGYTPVNDPMDLRAKFDPNTVNDPDHWQQLRYIDATGTLVTPLCIGPHWGSVTPFALTSGSQFRSSAGPALNGSDDYLDQAQALLNISANLTDEQKVIAEYWADGPSSELPPGHWNLFAQFVSQRDQHNVDSDVKLFFALTNAIFDAGIVAWDNKRAFDSVRPITAIRYLFQEEEVVAWGGPFQGTKVINGEEWTPYQASTFPTPPFQEYSSGHSNFSAAGAEILKSFTGSDSFGESATFPAGSSKFEHGAVPATDLTLSWATFSEAAAQAGISRRYGGIHFEQGDLDARDTGRLAGHQAWEKAQTFFDGTAPLSRKLGALYRTSPASKLQVGDHLK